MKIKQKANCSFAIRSIGEDVKNEEGKITSVYHEADCLDDKGHPKNFEFFQGTVHEVNEATGNFLLSVKVYADGVAITDFDGKIIPQGTLCTDFEEVK